MTIYDIAREAGVSIATVSRVMNGGKVGKATRIKVQAVLDSCDYQPSQVAKGLATRQSRCVAVMTMDIRDVHHAAIAYEIERTMATAGYSTILCNLGGTPARAGEYLRTLNAQQIIGVFFVGSIFVTPQCREYIAKYVPNIPILFANAVLPLPNAYGVLSDEEDGTYHAVKRLAQAGRRNIAFVNDDETESEEHKLNGYRRAIREYGLTERCYRAERSIEGGQFVTTHILQQDRKHRCYRLFRGYHRRGLPARAAGHRQAHPGRSRRHWLQQQRLLHHLLPAADLHRQQSARDRPRGRQADDPPFKPRIRCGKDHLPALPVGSAGYHPADAVSRRQSRHFL